MAAQDKRCAKLCKYNFVRVFSKDTMCICVCMPIIVVATERGSSMQYSTSCVVRIVIIHIIVSLIRR